MNIYNKLFILEYTRNPIHYMSGDKFWILNLSKDKYNYMHRNFDIAAYIKNNDYRSWKQYNKDHRLIGPAIIRYKNSRYTLIRDIENYKYYYIRNKITDLI